MPRRDEKTRTRSPSYIYLIYRLNLPTSSDVIALNNSDRIGPRLPSFTGFLLSWMICAMSTGTRAVCNASHLIVPRFRYVLEIGIDEYRRGTWDGGNNQHPGILYRRGPMR